jgi:hypothetical protein
VDWEFNIRTLSFKKLGKVKKKRPLQRLRRKDLFTWPLRVKCGKIADGWSYTSLLRNVGFRPILQMSILLVLLGKIVISFFSYVCWFVHHSIILKENPTRCNNVLNFYFIFIWSSISFGRHTAHHQEPKNALAASGFAYLEGCWTCRCWTLPTSSNFTSNNLPLMQNQKLLVQF